MKKENRGGVPLAGLTVAAILLASTAGYVSALSRMFQAPMISEESANDFLSADADTAAPAAKIPAASFEQSLGRMAAAWLVNALPGYSSGRARELWYLSLDSSGDRQLRFENAGGVNDSSNPYQVFNVAQFSSIAPAVTGFVGAPTASATPVSPNGPTAVDQTWKNSAGNTNFNDGASWNSGTPPGAGDRAIFATTGGSAAINAQPNLTVSVSIANLQFSQGTTSGYDLTSNSTSITLTLTSTLTTSGNQAIVASNTSGTNTIDAPIILGGGAGTTQTFSIASGGTFVINGVISESGAVTKISKTGNGTLTLTNSNSYTGGTNLTAGTIAVGSDTALGTGALIFSDGTTLRSADANTRTLSNAWSPASGTSNTILGAAGTGDLVLSDTTTFTLATTVKTFTINNDNTTLAKVFSSSGGTGNGITKAGAGRLLLTGSSTYTGGTTIDAGTLNAAVIANGGTASSIGQSTNVAARLVFGGGTLQYTGSTAASTDRLFTIGDANGNTATLDASGGSVGTLSFTNGGSIAFGNTNAHTLTFTGTNTGNNTFSPIIGDNTGATSLVKTGGGTWVLSGNNSYSGGTTLSNGLLQLNNNNALGSSNGQLTVNGGVLNLNDHSISVGNLTGSGGTIWNNIASNAVTLTIGNGNTGGGNYAGVIADRNVGGGTGTGTVALTKTGNGTITLSGANTYTGATIVNGGTLLVTGSTASGSAVTVNNSGTLGGTGTVSGTVQVNSGGTLSPGTSPGTLTTGAVTLANGSTFAVDLTASSGNDVLVSPSITLGAPVTGPSLSLNITGSLSMGQQFFIVDNTGANAVSGVFAQGATISSGQYTFLIDYLADFDTSSAAGGNDIMLQVTAIPEPSTWIGAALALGAVGLMQRRRLRSYPPRRIRP